MSEIKARYNEKYRLLIFGHIRNLSKVLNIEIPREICLVIHDFYPKLDEWDKSSIDNAIFNVDEETSMVKFIKVRKDWNSAYGTIRIRPMDFDALQIKNSGDEFVIIQTWKVKIVKVYEGIMIIGLVKSSQIKNVKHAFISEDRGYGIWGSERYNNTTQGSTTERYNKQGDIIEISLLFKDGKCCIGYKKPDTEIEIAFTDLNKSEYYSLAVALYSEGDCIQIVE